MIFALGGSPCHAGTNRLHRVVGREAAVLHRDGQRHAADQRLGQRRRPARLGRRPQPAAYHSSTIPVVPHDEQAGGAGLLDDFTNRPRRSARSPARRGILCASRRPARGSC